MSECNGATAGPRILEGFDVLPPLETETPRAPKAGKPKKPKVEHDAKGKGQTGNRFRSINAFLDATAKTLPPSAALLWVLLWRDVKPDGLARTSQADLARRSGLCLRTVKVAMRLLQAKGLVYLVYRGNLRRGPSAYRLFSVPKQDVE